MNNDQLKGLLEEVIGRFKEVAGKIVNDKKMELEGNIQMNAGKAQASWEDVKEVIKKDSRTKITNGFIVKPMENSSAHSTPKYLQLYFYRILK